MIGPGKYDDLATAARAGAHAKGVVLIVFGGVAGNGFSAQLSPMDMLGVPAILRAVANHIEQDLAGVGGRA